MTTDKYLLQIQLDVQNDQALKAMTTQLQKASKAAKATQGVMKRTAVQTRNYGNIAQNVGYQVQDMAVQIQGGVDPMQAMSQQIPQMLVGFGAWGAAIGVVTALLPTLIALMGDTDDISKGLTKDLENLAAAVDGLGDTITQLDMNGWINSFNEMDAQARLLAKSILDIRLQAAQLNFEQAIASFTSFANAMLPAGRLADIQLQSMADNLGLSVGALEQLIPLVREFRADPFGNPENLEQMVELIKTAGTDAEPLLRQLEQLKAAQQSLETGRATIGAARQAGAGTIPTGQGEGGTTPAPAEALEKTASAAAEAAIALNDYNQQQIEFANETERLTRLYSKEVPEAFSFSEEAAGIFTKSLDTMLDGVLSGTQSLSDGFRDMSKVILAELLKLAAVQGFSALFPNIQLTPSAKGNVFGGGSVIPFANGGIVNGPTLFPMANGAGLMGESGPEAVLPLSRNSAGRLGVESSGMNVTINNNAPGVAVKANQGDNGLTVDIVLEQVANSVRRGGNSVANALEDTYSVGRGRAVY